VSSTPTACACGAFAKSACARHPGLFFCQGLAGALEKGYENHSAVRKGLDGWELGSTEHSAETGAEEPGMGLLAIARMGALLAKTAKVKQGEAWEKRLMFCTAQQGARVASIVPLLVSSPATTYYLLPTPSYLLPTTYYLLPRTPGDVRPGVR
jgi:hypothetical protein